MESRPGRKRQILDQDPAHPAVAAPVRPVEERKVVTVLVAGLTAESPADPEDLRAHAETSLEQVRERVEHYGGVVQALVMGRLLAVFGVPRSHEDDPERAVRAALEVCDQVHTPARGQQVRAGVATGEVVMTVRGDTGADAADPAALSVAGDVVHAAVALQELAPSGGVVAGAGTYRATRRVIEYRPLSQAMQLEQTTGSAAWQALAPRGRTGAEVVDPFRSPLMERARELMLLTDLLGRFLRETEPQLITIIGEPGLGKSRLVAELGGLADRAPELVTWRRGRSRPHEEDTLGALAEIVRSHAGILSNDPAEVAAGKLENLVGGVIPDLDEEAAWVTRQLRVLLVPDLSVPAQGERKAEVVAGWTRFLAAAAADRPLIVVFEDLQWADDALLDFVEDLPDQIGPVSLLVVATGRPELLDRRPGWGGGKRNAATLSLAPLSPAGTAELLDALLAGMRLPEETVQALITSSGGNPLYVEEYARMLRDQETPASGGSLPIPESVQQLLAARLDALPAEEKVLLQDAAVTGEVCWPGTLAAVGGRARAEVDAGLRALERRQLLRRARASSVAGETEYSFRHALVRDVAYAQMLRGPRAEKHRQVAAWIESLSPEHADDRIDQLAHHYTQALSLDRAGGEPDPTLTARTREVLRTAGDRALWLGAYASAERSYGGALELWPRQDPGRAELLFGQALARMYGKHTSGDQELLEARAAFDQAGRPERAAHVLVLLSLSALMRGEHELGDTYLRQALTGDVPPGPELSRALANRALGLMISDQGEEAARVGAEALGMAREFHDLEAEGVALLAVGVTQLKDGRLDGDDLLARGVELVNRQRAPISVYAYYDRAWGLWWYGELGRCATVTAAGLAAAVRTEVATALWFRTMQAELDYVAGRWDAALAFAEEELSHKPRGLDGYLVPWYWLIRARIQLGRGDLDAAAAGARTVLSLPGNADPRFRQQALALQGLTAAAAGGAGAAAAPLELLLAEQRAQPHHAFVTPEQGLLMARLDTGAGALPSNLRPTRWTLATQAMAGRDTPGAARCYDQIGSAVDAALARVEAVRRGQADRAALEAAVEVLETAGAAAWLKDADATGQDW